jgi:hypothetical protein
MKRPAYLRFVARQQQNRIGVSVGVARALLSALGLELLVPD